MLYIALIFSSYESWYFMAHSWVCSLWISFKISSSLTHAYKHTIHIHIYILIYHPTHKHTHIYIHTHTLLRSFTYILTNLHTLSHTYLIQAYAHTHTHSHAYTYTDTYIHLQTHTHIHTHHAYLSLLGRNTDTLLLVPQVANFASSKVGNSIDTFIVTFRIVGLGNIFNASST